MANRRHLPTPTKGRGGSRAAPARGRSRAAPVPTHGVGGGWSAAVEQVERRLEKRAERDPTTQAVVERVRALTADAKRKDLRDAGAILLAGGISPEETARALGVRRATIYLWTRDPDFADALHEYRRIVVEQIADRALSRGSAAIDALANIMRDEAIHPGERIRAAESLLDRIGFTRHAPVGGQPLVNINLGNLFAAEDRKQEEPKDDPWTQRLVEIVSSAQPSSSDSGSSGSANSGFSGPVVDAEAEEAED